MPVARKTQYKKAARLFFKGEAQWRSTLAAGIHANEKIAKAKAWILFDEEKGNQHLLAELNRLEAIEFEDAKLSKKEKLETSAQINRKVADKLLEQLDEETDGDLDNKLVDSFVKLGKRDDALQGHAIQAETNPQDKRDALLTEWFLDIQKTNEEKRVKEAEDAIDI